jgi:ABC-2 type transport system ATP-binding protein
VNGTPAVVVDNVSKRYRVYHERNSSLKERALRWRRSGYEEFWALRDVSLEIEPGATFGLIGENGCGKSTLLKCIANILRPDAGSIEARGKVSALIELGAGFHPELSGRDNVFLNGSLLGLSTKEIERRFDDIVGFSELDHFIDTPVKNYSSGMFMRLGFSIAINVDPEILLIDEILAVGDEAFQRRCLERIRQLRAEGCTIVLVSHALETMRVMCDHAALLSHGELVTVGSTGAVIDEYLGLGSGRIAQPSETHARWGSGEILVQDFEWLDLKGKPLERLRSGQGFRLRCSYVAHEPVVDPSFGISLKTVEGIVVTVPTTTDTGVATGTLLGEGHIDLVVDRLPLGPGVYSLSAFVHDEAGTHPYDVRHNAFDVTVGAGPKKMTSGVVAVHGHWTTPVARR